jgi:protein-tyrosine kinase
MGKVYDALRRAEAQRSERSAGVAPGTASIETAIDRAARARAPRRGRQSLGDRLRAFRAWLTPGKTRRIAEDAGAINKRRIALLQPDSYVAEQFRTLRARLDSAGSERPLRTLALTSAVSGEGKTLSAVNLALVMAMSVGKRVLLVDCDLRKPKVHAALNLNPECGLAEVLTGQASLDRALTKVEGTNLEALPVRSTPGNPSELLASERMRALVQELSQRYDHVIFDLPPALALPDAKIVSELTDGLILVVRADETPQQDVEATLDLLDRRRVLGVLLNGAVTDTERYGH